MSTALTITTNTQKNRVYLNVKRENIWITRPTEEQMTMLRSKTLDDVQVIRFRTEKQRTLYYLQCEDYSSLVTAEQASLVLYAQKRISFDELSKLKKPADVEKIVNLRTVQQVPYWIETFNENDEPVSAAKAKWYVVKFKEHYLSKHVSRADAQKAIKMLTELGQPQVNAGLISFTESKFTILATNWRDLNPCTEFVCFLEGTMPRTQFENTCTALVPYTPLLPVTHQAQKSKRKKSSKPKTEKSPKARKISPQPKKQQAKPAASAPKATTKRKK